MCGQGIVWVWCEYGYGVDVFDKFVDQLTWDKWEFLLELSCYNISYMNDLLVNILTCSCDWGGWWVGRCD
jgi:hypothetical protein